MTIKRLISCAAIFLGCLLVSQSLKAQFDSAQFNKKTKGPLKITRITPAEDDVPAKRQIVFKFNMPMVPVGRMERRQDEIPITITPPLNGQWRWLNTSSLALQLGEHERMKNATKYKIQVYPEFKSSAGNTMIKGITHSFITTRPKIRYFSFQSWKAPGHPVIRIDFNQRVTRESALSKIQFKGNTGQRIRPIEGEAAQNSVTTSINIEPSTELELDSEYHLDVYPGIVSEEGLEKGIEDRTLVYFQTFPEFQFLGISGSDINGRGIQIDPQGRPDYQFNPLRRITLLFTAPVSTRQEGPKLEFDPGLTGGRTDYDPWAYTSTGSYLLTRPHKKGKIYRLRIPERLKADQVYRLKSQDDFQDMFGRNLLESIQMTFKTDHRPPSLHIKNRISALEKNVETHLPLVITNISNIHADYRLLKNPQDFWTLKSLVHCSGNFNANQKRSFQTDMVEDVAYFTPFKVRDILEGKSGALAGVLTTDPPNHGSCPQFFTQVTNLGVNIKLGYHNTTAWVVRLDNGQPVKNANVEVFLYQQNVPAASGMTDGSGLAMLKGTVDIDPSIKYLQNDLYNAYGVVRVTTGDDQALLPLIWQFRGGYDYYGPNRPIYSHMRAWGTSDQGIYRAGDTIRYKIFVRDQSNRKFITPELSTYDLEVKDPMGKRVLKKDKITLSKFGSTSGKLLIPKGSTSGWYRFYLTGNYGKTPSWQPLKVLVTDFTPAPFKVNTVIKGKLFKIDDRVNIETTSRLHSGGPYGNAGARITAHLTRTRFQTRDKVARQFYFMDDWRTPSKKMIFQTEKSLDQRGDLASSFILRDTDIVAGKLSIESAVRDDRGKYVAASATADFMGRDRLVGLKHEKWVLKEDEETEFRLLVVNEHGEPVSGTMVQARVEYDRVTGSRVKGAGNAYIMQYHHKQELVQKYEMVSGATPLTCRFTPREPGRYFLIATVKDTAGRLHTSRLQKYVVGKGRILWAMPDDNSLSIIPAQEEYQVGEKARFMVKNPYPGARALITIERLGVMKKWTRIFQSNTPIIEFDVDPDYVPGFYLTVVLQSHRVDQPLGDNNVDLGKPTIRTGSLTVRVNDPYKRLNIRAQTNRDVYKPREKVTLDLDVSDINKNHPQTELAVAVLDEAVLDLIQGGTDYYDPYKGFYKLGASDVRNYNLLFRLIGRQKFEKKGASSGGGGGDSEVKMRSLFKFVSYWNPEIRPDKNGKARVDFDLPDNLTGWRVLVLGVTKNDLMGLGQTRFVTNQPTEIRPALPNQVTEGDIFDAVFTVMNRTENERKLSVEISVKGESVEEDTVKDLIAAAPYVRQKVRMTVQTKKSGQATFEVLAGDSRDRDGLILPLNIFKKQAIEAAATYGTTTASRVSELFHFPENMRDDTGRVSVVVSPSIISSLEGAFAYMKKYPYYCWEQRLSKGIMAMHFINLRPYIPKSFEWKNAKKIVLAMISDAKSFQAPNGAMCYYIPRDRYASPYLSAYTAMAFNWLKESGYKPGPEVERKLHQYLLNLLRRDSFPSFFTKGMSSTVRAVALAALAQNSKINTYDLKRYLPHVEDMDLFGKAHFLLAATFLDDTRDIQEKVYDIIMSHANETGGKVIFTDTIYGDHIAGGFGRILTSEIRTNAAVLSSLLSMEEGRIKFTGHDTTRDGSARVSTDTAFKMVRYLTQSRKNRDHWENTQENAFCMQALTRFSRIYDKEKPGFTITASMDRKNFGITKFNDLRNPPEEFARPVKQGDPGRKTEVFLKKKGPGRVYYSARLFYSPKKLKLEPINSGIEVKREYYLEKDGKWVFLDNSTMNVKQGDIVRVDLFVSIPAARNFVVVADPVPGGLEPVNRDLATSSNVDADKAGGTYAGSSWWHKYGDWRAYGYSRWSFYHREMLHHSVRFYSDYLPAGNYHLSYAAQAIAAGEFYVMPLHAEEMYDPDVFGQGVPSELRVEPMD